VSISVNHRMLFAIALAALGQAYARPPAELNFGNIKFAKIEQRLYPDPVKRVCLKQELSETYPSAVVFTNRIIFLNKDGRDSGRDTFPESKDIKITESAHGEYIYIFATFGKEKPGGFHRLYKSDGTKVFAREDTAAVGTVGYGIPLESKDAFVRGGFGKLTIVKFDGEELASKQLLDANQYEDGDIYTAVDPAEQRIFVAANRFKVPSTDDKAYRPIMYGFDLNLAETFRDTLDALLALSLVCSENGKYLGLRAECVDNSSPLWIYNSDGQKLASFDNPKVLAVASGSDLLINLPREASPEIVSSLNWDVSYQPKIPNTDFPWSDASIASNGTLAMLYNGNEIALINIAQKSWHKLPFPFAFENSRFYDDGTKLIFRGEFGFIVYQLTR
jgi:hypothetical protein